MGWRIVCRGAGDGRWVGGRERREAKLMGKQRDKDPEGEEGCRERKRAQEGEIWRERPGDAGDRRGDPHWDEKVERHFRETGLVAGAICLAPGFDPQHSIWVPCTARNGP